ncbi:MULTISPECIES: hypothetical protein [Vibrio]|uniref:AlpA family phage regulatory protein n=2 Tax=Vibrio TaxID=662 RepID=A0A2A1YW63_VIBCL|nr:MULTISPECIES: hypothetical protein [Vibrio]AMG01515.1 hypothetical protein AL543_00290 [Vibrio mimicus]EEX64670.1 conserved hypothetical protein [Vibrio metoecus]EEY99603.1 conserved hypothetical protein [Vibrio sp. RC586]EGQ8188380.1 hypothetical protein [Vibrio cholerae]EGQ8474661.1 hypothetical protein [Vibrio cholerae]
MSQSQISIITLKKAAEVIGLSTKTLRHKAREGFYPSTIVKKICGTWMVDIEEWNKWHRMQ